MWPSDLLLNVKECIPSAVSSLYYQILLEAAEALQLDKVKYLHNCRIKS